MAARRRSGSSPHKYFPKVFAYTRVMQYPLVQRTQVKHHTHVFGCIVRFPLTPTPAKEESAGEKVRLFYLIFSNKEREKNSFKRVDGGIAGVETKSTNRSTTWWGRKRQKLAKDEVIRSSRGPSGRLTDALELKCLLVWMKLSTVF